MDSPQALSTVYAIAAKALAVAEPLESLRFEKPVPYTRTNLVTAITKVTGLKISAPVGAEVEEDAVFQACGLVLAKAVGNAATSPLEVFGVFQLAFKQLIEAYCKLARQSVRNLRNVVSVATAIELEIALMSNWQHLRRTR